MDLGMDNLPNKENIIAPPEDLNISSINTSLKPFDTNLAIKQSPNLIKSIMGGPHKCLQFFFYYSKMKINKYLET